jgi:hypothetical protein
MYNISGEEIPDFFTLKQLNLGLTKNIQAKLQCLQDWSQIN